MNQLHDNFRLESHFLHFAHFDSEGILSHSPEPTRKTTVRDHLSTISIMGSLDSVAFCPPNQEVHMVEDEEWSVASSPEESTELGAI